MQANMQQKLSLKLSTLKTAGRHYISRDDALKLDRVREALLAGDLAAASQYGKV